MDHRGPWSPERAPSPQHRLRPRRSRTGRYGWPSGTPPRHSQRWRRTRTGSTSGCTPLKNRCDHLTSLFLVQTFLGGCLALDLFCGMPHHRGIGVSPAGTLRRKDHSATEEPWVDETPYRGAAHQVGARPRVGADGDLVREGLTAARPTRSVEALNLPGDALHGEPALT